MTTSLPIPLGPADSPDQAWPQTARRRYLRPAPARETPLAILVVGQPGAGKSVLAASLRATFDLQGGCVSIDPTELAQLHPGYVTGGQRDEREVWTQLRPDAADLAADLFEQAVSRRQDLLLECTFDTADAAELLLGYLREQRYQTLVVVAVAAPVISWRDVQRRYRRQCDTWPVGRRIERDYHDEVFENLLSVLERIETGRLADELHLIGREGQVLASLTRSDGFVPGTCRRVYAQIGQAPAEERPASLPPEEKRAVRQRRELQRVLRRYAAAERRG